MTRVEGQARRTRVVASALVASACVAWALGPGADLATASQRAGGAGGQTPSAKAEAPHDLTGYWVAVVTKDWRFRMLVPAKGDIFGPFGGPPLNDAGRKASETWDPARDEAAGEACRGFGAAGLMRVPTRLRISWQDDNVMRMETDAGMQSRSFRFAPGTPAKQRTWQGDSAARWVLPAAAQGGRGGAGTRGGYLQVVTTNMRAGYLRRNGVPYSERTVMTEYFHVLQEPDGTEWLLVSSTIEDPTYLRIPYETSPVFKRERDGAKWDPSPCSARW